ncbi:MAG: NAD(P)/FAD-dependent oxidoreductase, partial [Gaiellaceae bacterium]
MSDIKDITIIGAGPTGLFAAFYAGMRGVSSRIVDALVEPGGQLTALYPEKYIFDVAGFAKILAKDLVKGLVEQAAQWNPEYRLGEQVIALEEDGGHFTLVTDSGRHTSRSIVIAAGIGAFTPRRLPQPSAEPWYGRGIHDRVTDPERFRGQRVLIIGGGDSAFDWAHQLLDRAASLTLIHRSDRFRAHAATVSMVRDAAGAGRCRLLTFHELAAVIGNGDHITGAAIKDVKAKTQHDLEVDAILPMLGFVSDIGALAEWGLTV